MLPVQRFVKFIEQNNLFTAQNRILLAVSGGMDSVLMAHLFKAAGYNFGIAHCNFMLRGADADADQQFCQSLAQQLDVPFYTINFDTPQFANQHKLSVQIAARELRYNWFEQIRQQHGFKAIALGHHQNDTIETILLNLTRGTGIAGLHGIQPKNGHLVRPLLFMGRDEVKSIVEEQQIAYVEDASNASTKYARNKLRHEVVPVLKSLNPNLENTFENNLRHFRQLEKLLEQQVQTLNSALINYRDDEVSIAISEVKKLFPQQLLLFKLLQPFGFIEPVVDDLIAALDSQPGKAFRSATHNLIIDRGKLLITPVAGLEPPLPVTLNQDDVFAVYGQYRLNLLHEETPLIVKDNPSATSIDAEKLVYPLTMRHWQQSDYFYPLGMKTRQKLSDFFVHQKVPLHKKSQVPLLVNGNGDIIWVAGYRPDDRYKVTRNTKKVTIFELLKVT